MEKLKRAVLREEYYELLHDHILAIILNQLIYLSLTNFEKSNGWIYKSAKEIKEETMLNISETTIRRYIRQLIKMGFIEERNNPKYKWDKTKQYRVNEKKVKYELGKINYSLSTAIE